MQGTMELKSSTGDAMEKVQLFRTRLHELEDGLKMLRELRHNENRLTLGKAFNRLERLQAESEDMCHSLQADIFAVEQQMVC